MNGQPPAIPSAPESWPPELSALALPLVGGEFWDALELRVTAQELQALGLTLSPIETQRGRGMRAALSYKGVRCLLTSYAAEGPHYYMLSLDIASAVERCEPPDAVVQELASTLSLPTTSKCSETSLDRLFHLRADEKFAREVLGIERLTGPD